MPAKKMTTSSIARPPGRARIETWTKRRYVGSVVASPGLPAGRGLKLDVGVLHVVLGTHRPASRPGAD